MKIRLERMKIGMKLKIVLKFKNEKLVNGKVKILRIKIEDWDEVKISTKIVRNKYL